MKIRKRSDDDAQRVKAAYEDNKKAIDGASSERSKGWFRAIFELFLSVIGKNVKKDE